MTLIAFLNTFACPTGLALDACIIDTKIHIRQIGQRFEGASWVDRCHDIRLPGDLQAQIQHRLPSRSLLCLPSVIISFRGISEGISRQDCNTVQMERKHSLSRRQEGCHYSQVNDNPRWMKEAWLWSWEDVVQSRPATTLVLWHRAHVLLGPLFCRSWWMATTHVLLC